MNSEFLKKADENLPHLKNKRITPSLPLTVLDNGDELVVDLGNHYVGYLSFRMWYVDEYIDAPVTLCVRFCEIEKELYDDYSEYGGWLCKSWLQEDTVKIDFPGEYRMPRRYAARYVKISVVNTPKKLSLSEICFDSVTGADESKLTEYSTSDKQLAAIDKVAVNTLKNCMQRVFEDGPKRDRRLWIGDLRLEALANYYTFHDTSLVKRCLYLFAAANRNEIGFLSAFVYENPVFYSGSWHIVDYSFMYVCSLCDYFNHIGDKDLFLELYPLAKDIMDSADKMRDDNGLVRVPEGDMFIDWCPGLKKFTAFQGAYLYTLSLLTDTLARLEHGDAALFEKRLSVAREAARSHLYHEGLGRFINEYDDGQFSVHSTAWMTLGGVLNREEGRGAMLDALRSDGSVKPFTPYMHHYVVDALMSVGLVVEAEEYIRKIWGGMVELGTDTFFEVYVPVDEEFSPYDDRKVNSMCHAWSCTPTYFIRKYGLGK